MPVRRLPKRAAQLFIDDILIPDCDASGAHGFDLAANEGSDGFLPVATDGGDVGEQYPSLVVTFSNETSGGETSYDFITTNGPGQQRDGQLLVTARAQDREADYTGDSSTYSAVDAETLVATLIDEVEDVCLSNAQGGNTDLSYVGSQPTGDVPDDREETPPVRIDQCVVPYGWLRAP
jgi:hypothetical protein